MWRPNPVRHTFCASLFYLKSAFFLKTALALGPFLAHT
jgi:hypothetical protein